MMIRFWKILLLILTAELLGGSEELRAQARATATVTIIVLPRPAVNFDFLNSTKDHVNTDAGISFDMSSNVVIHVLAHRNDKSFFPVNSDPTEGAAFNFQDGKGYGKNKITSQELSKASEVKIEYLGE
jgi:hypothetical protein